MRVLLALSVLILALQIVAYRRETPGSEFRTAAAISGSLWLLITVWCVVQLVDR